MSLSEKEEGFTDYARALEILQQHTRECPDCLAFIRSFPADDPAYPQHEPTDAAIIPAIGLLK